MLTCGEGPSDAAAVNGEHSVLVVFPEHVLDLPGPRGPHVEEEPIDAQQRQDTQLNQEEREQGHPDHPATAATKAVTDIQCVPPATKCAYRITAQHVEPGRQCGGTLLRRSAGEGIWTVSVNRARASWWQWDLSKLTA